MTQSTSQKIVNPIIQSDSADTLAHCSDCLAYITESVGVLRQGELSPMGFVGMQMLLDCVRSAIDYEHERLSTSKKLKQPLM